MEKMITYSLEKPRQRSGSIQGQRNYVWPWEMVSEESDGKKFKPEPEWVKLMIARGMRIIIAMDTPIDMPKSVKAFWFDIVRERVRDYVDNKPVRIVVTPKQVDAADEIALWVQSLPDRTLKVIVSAKALGVSTPRLAAKIGTSPRSIDRWYAQAIKHICQVLTESYLTGEPILINVESLGGDVTPPSFRLQK